MLCLPGPGLGLEPRAAPGPLAYSTSCWLEPRAPGWLVPAPFCSQTSSLIALSLALKPLLPQGLDALFSWG